MKHKTTLVTAAIFVPAFFSTAAFADFKGFTPEKVSAGIGLGTLSGEAKERVYDPDTGGRKISQLNWKYKNAAIIKGNVDWDVHPRLTIGAGGWTTLASKGGQMDDYDWLNKNQQHWTDHSDHPNTRLNYANQFDLNIKGWLLNTPNYRLGLMAGYTQSAFSWGSKGGNFNYDNGTRVGSFDPRERAIGYSQKFKIPYIGLSGLYRYQKFELSGEFKYSGWAKSSDNDEHYARSLTFREKVKNQDYYSVSASAGYYVTEQAKVYLEGTWNRMLNKKGDTFVHDYKRGLSGVDEDAAGIEHSNLIVAAGLKYSF